MHHPQSDVDRLYLPRKEGGRGLISIEDCIRGTETGLHSYVSNSMEPFLKQVSKSNILKNPEGENSLSYKKRRKNEREDKFNGKVLHSQFAKATNFKDEKSWEWLRKGTLISKICHLYVGCAKNEMRQ